VKRFVDVEDEVYELNVEYCNGKMVKANELRSITSG
jgi:hypothetical protein